MPSAPLISLSDSAASSVELDAEVFGAAFNGPLVHETVRADLNARRQGTSSTKTRGLVSGGSAKPWRQKGTGRARAGSSRSPVWVGGGTVFGPQPRHYTFKVNRKARKAALRSALSVHASRESLAIFRADEFEKPATKLAFELLHGWVPTGTILVLIDEADENAFLSLRNLSRVRVIAAENAAIADIIGANSLLISEGALSGLVARASKSTDTTEVAA
jgi:large subunit ribosomal protein L4